MPHIAIVGGGPGGLFTAWRIEQMASEPMAITIFEASDRVGGKLASPTFSTAAIRYEAGAAELYHYEVIGDDPLWHLVRSLGLVTVPLAGAAVHVTGNQIATVDDIEATCGIPGREELASFDTWARSAITRREFYDSGADHAGDACPQSRFDVVMGAIRAPVIRTYIETMIHSDLATEPTATTVAYGLQNYLMNDPSYMRLYRIAGGNEQLACAVASRLAAEVRLDTAVSEVCSWPDGRLRIEWRAGDRTGHDTFDMVIVALPVAALQAIAFGGDALALAMKRHVVHHDHPAHYLRITHLLDGPVPTAPGQDDYLMVDSFGGACLYIESGRDSVGRHGVLGWLLGGEAAERMAALSDAALVDAALDALPPAFACCRGRVLESRVHRWVGAVNAVPGGWSPLPVAARHRPSPDHPNLFVVGDYLYDSTLNGVLDSAEYVAGWVAVDLMHPTAASNSGTTNGFA